MVRTRFAPSPTGYLHIGGLRTALYNYLYARKHGGKFLLRIEDTDQKRYVEGATQHIIDMINWAGLDFDEGPGKEGDVGPYIQSERTALYQKHAYELLEKGHAYRCFCTAERLDEMRNTQVAQKKAPMYDRHCLYLSEEEIQKKLAEGAPFVIRQKVPSGDVVKFKDLIRGNVSFSGKTIDDQVLLKSDEFPTYHLANVVDDHYMNISHVIRGEEWLPSTPKHILLYQAFGWTPPEFAHIPLLLNKDRSKLSKRQGDVSVEDYINKGYTREALLNFIAFLGWHPGGAQENELFSLEELINNFSMEKVHKAGAIFDIEKLDWINWQWNRRNYHEYLTKKAKEIDANVNIEELKKGAFSYNFNDTNNAAAFFEIRTNKLIEMCEENLPAEMKSNKEKLRKILISVEEKILRDSKEIKSQIDFYFEDKPYEKDLLTHEKMNVDLEVAKNSLLAIREKFESLDDFNSEEKIKNALMEVVEKLGYKNGQVLWPLRAALTGEQFSPGAFEVAWALGKEPSLGRINKALIELEKA
ncbi:glutamate--tRNA ligase [Patescibacteria group bacterium]|nr:glutamate--tRNA ligase [Patescibacteria group bacterium]